ncbi:MAG: RDD family protein [Anaerolineae bacterium]
MVAYKKLTNELAQNDIQYVEMRFAANESITTVECGTQTYEFAPLRARIIAAAIDLFILTVVEFICSSVLGTAGLLASLAFLFVFQWYFLSERFGQTPGKMVMNIFVIRADGEFPSARDAFWRTVGYLLNMLCLGLGWLWIIGDRHEQGWHDKLAHTYVVKS